VVFVLAGAALTIAHHASATPLPRAAAISDALRAPAVTRALAGSHWSSASVTPLGGSLERVTFSAESRTVLEAAVRRNGTVDGIEAFARHGVPYGDWIAYEPGALGGLSALFVLMTGVLPLRRRRNLDVLAMLSLVPSVVLFQDGYLEASVGVVLPGLLYLAWRCARRGLGYDGGSRREVTLFKWLTRSWDQHRRLRLLRIGLAALVLVYVMVGVSSPQAIDVAYAAMEGATKLIAGVLPYGHMPGDVIHGDTYPIFTYALYAPLALVAPVHSTWGPIDAALGLSVLAALAVSAAVVWAAGGRLFRARERGDGRGGDDVTAVGNGIAVLAFPPLLIAASTGTTDVALGAIVAFAVLLWRRPALSTGLLAVAGWFKLAPFVLLPVWLAPRRGRRLVRAVLALALVTGVALGLVLALGGTHGVAAMVRAVEFQFDRGSLQSPWGTLVASAFQPLAQAAALALVAFVGVLLAQRTESEIDSTTVAGLTGALLIVLQLVGNYWSFLYLSWTVPLIGMSLLGSRTQG
jgi:hypothetical protein